MRQGTSLIAGSLSSPCRFPFPFRNPDFVTQDTRSARRAEGNDNLTKRLPVNADQWAITDFNLFPVPNEVDN